MSIEQINQLRQTGQHEAARQLAIQLIADHPDDAQLQYATACVHDFLGYESQAVDFYRAALAGELPQPMRREALLGIGSTLRVLGQYDDARRIFDHALHEFPDGNEFKVFLAMTLHNQGQHQQAVQLLLQVIAHTSDDPNIQPYRRAIELYAQDVTKIWP